MSINLMGTVVYSHEASPTWNINTYIQTLQQQEGFTPREIFWRVWSVVNTLLCDQCHRYFQCSDLMGCPYHPLGLTHHLGSGDATYECCSQPVAQFTVFPSSLQVLAINAVAIDNTMPVEPKGT